MARKCCFFNILDGKKMLLFNILDGKKMLLYNILDGKEKFGGKRETVQLQLF